VSVITQSLDQRASSTVATVISAVWAARGEAVAVVAEDGPASAWAVPSPSCAGASLRGSGAILGFLFDHLVCLTVPVAQERGHPIS